MIYELNTNFPVDELKLNGVVYVPKAVSMEPTPEPRGTLDATCAPGWYLCHYTDKRAVNVVMYWNGEKMLYADNGGQFAGEPLQSDYTDFVRLMPAVPLSPPAAPEVIWGPRTLDWGGRWWHIRNTKMALECVYAGEVRPRELLAGECAVDISDLLPLLPPAPPPAPEPVKAPRVFKVRGANGDERHAVEFASGKIAVDRLSNGLFDDAKDMFHYGWSEVENGGTNER